jgi:hypothetical protein
VFIATPTRAVANREGVEPSNPEASGPRRPQAKLLPVSRDSPAIQTIGTAGWQSSIYMSLIFWLDPSPQRALPLSNVGEG